MVEAQLGGALSCLVLEWVMSQLLWQCQAAHPIGVAGGSALALPSGCYRSVLFVVQLWAAWLPVPVRVWFGMHFGAQCDVAIADVTWERAIPEDLGELKWGTGGLCP